MVQMHRSLLFVPAHKPWAEKAARSGTDAIIFDLEDSVPEEQKGAARSVISDAIATARTTNPAIGILVRPNALDTVHYGADVDAAVRAGADALLLPKICHPRDVLDFVALARHFEIGVLHRRSPIELMPSLETALGFRECEEIAACSPRVTSMLVAAARDSDVSRELGYSWTPEGLESLYTRSRGILACRAAGIAHVVVGLWQDIDDLEGLRRFASANHGLGFRGQVLIHPSHVATVNDVFRPHPAVMERYRRMVDEFEAAQARGESAITFEGEHVDLAHIKTARQILGDGYEHKENV